MSQNLLDCILEFIVTDLNLLMEELKNILFETTKITHIEHYQVLNPIYWLSGQ